MLITVNATKWTKRFNDSRHRPFFTQLLSSKTSSPPPRITPPTHKNNTGKRDLEIVSSWIVSLVRNIIGKTQQTTLVKTKNNRVRLGLYKILICCINSTSDIPRLAAAACQVYFIGWKRIRVINIGKREIRPNNCFCCCNAVTPAGPSFCYHYYGGPPSPPSM